MTKEKQHSEVPSLWNLHQICVEFGISRTTVLKRLNGIKPDGVERGRDGWYLKNIQQALAGHIMTPREARSLQSKAENLEKTVKSLKAKLSGKDKKIKELEEALSSGLDSDGNSDPNRMTPKNRLDFFKSENEQLKFLQNQSVLIPVDEVVRQFSDIAKQINLMLVTLPDTLERDCNLDRATVSKVDYLIDKARASLREALQDE